MFHLTIKVRIRNKRFASVVYIYILNCNQIRFDFANELEPSVKRQYIYR